MIKPISQFFQNTTSSEVIKVLYIFQVGEDTLNYIAYQDQKNNINISKDFISNDENWEAIPVELVDIYNIENNFNTVNPLIESKPVTGIGFTHILRGLTVNNKVQYLFGENINDDWVINQQYMLA